jgi:hypothetical protein
VSSEPRSLVLVYNQQIDRSECFVIQFNGRCKVQDRKGSAGARPQDVLCYFTSVDFHLDEQNRARAQQAVVHLRCSGEHVGPRSDRNLVGPCRILADDGAPGWTLRRHNSGEIHTSGCQATKRDRSQIVWANSPYHQHASAIASGGNGLVPTFPAWLGWTIALAVPYLGLIDGVTRKGAADVPYPVFALLRSPSRLQRP